MNYDIVLFFYILISFVPPTNNESISGEYKNSNCHQPMSVDIFIIHQIEVKQKKIYTPIIK
jgi:hypothetical protein